MAAIPAWKQALLERKRQQAMQVQEKTNEEEKKLSQLPPWKRDLILKKKTVVPGQGSASLINDNMSFGGGGGFTNKASTRESPTSIEVDRSNKTVNHSSSPQSQMNGSLSTSVTCRDVYNANIVNGHTNSYENSNNDQPDGEGELEYQPGIVSKLRDKFKVAKNDAQPVIQNKRRSITPDHQIDIGSKPRTPPPVTAEKKIIRRSEPSSSPRVSPVISPPQPVKTDIHDNNNVPNGTLDSVDAKVDFSLQSKTTTTVDERNPVKNKVSSILSKFESGKSKAPAPKRNSRSEVVIVRSSVIDPIPVSTTTKPSVINEPVSKQPEPVASRPESQIKETTGTSKPVANDSKAVISKQSDAVVKPKVVTGTVASGNTKVKETSDENLSKIRQAGQSWLFGSDGSAKAETDQVPEKRPVTKPVVRRNDPELDKPEEEILVANSSVEEQVPSFKPPPATLPDDGYCSNDSNQGNRAANIDRQKLTLNLEVAAPVEKKGSFSKKGATSPKISKKDKVKSPEKEKKPSPEKKEKVSSPEKKKGGIFGAFRKTDRSKVKVVEVKEKAKKNENPNFHLGGTDSPLSSKKRQAPQAPINTDLATPSKAAAPPPPVKSAPRADSPTEVPALPVIDLAGFQELDTPKPKVTVPSSLPSTERKAPSLDSKSFHVSPEVSPSSPDVPVTNIDDLILSDTGQNGAVTSSEDNFDYDFLDEELSIKPRPVKFASVEFAGAGVKLDKSSLAQNKEKKEKKTLKFEEASPETYEYPSEQSLMESPGQPSANNDVGDSSTDNDSDVCDDGGTNDVTSSGLTSTPAIGSTSLGGYRGKFVDDYKLGARPAQKPDEDVVVAPRRTSVSDRESDSGDEIVINPAGDEDDAFQWSENGSVDILF